MMTELIVSLFAVLFRLIFAVFVVVLLAYVTQVAWAHSVAPIFKVRHIGWQEAAWLNLLCLILFNHSIFLPGAKE
jgi:hypothetical protein